MSVIKNYSKGLPWWLRGKESAGSVGDMGLIPGLERSHMLRSNKASGPQLLSLCSRAQELQLLSPRLPQLLEPAHPRAHALQQESHHDEKPTHYNQRGALTHRN